MAHPMSDDEIRDLLAGDPPRPATLATVRADGRPHLVPVWIALDADAAGTDAPLGEIVFNTGADTVKGANLAREPRVALCVDDDRPPYAFVSVEGVATLVDDLDEVRRWAEVIGGRYLGPDRAEEMGRRNGVPGELVVRVRPTRVTGVAELAD